MLSRAGNDCVAQSYYRFAHATPIQVSLVNYRHLLRRADLDRAASHLGMVVDEAELAPLEEHLLSCPRCVERAEEAAAYVDTLRAAMITGNFDLE
jgi:hypothetical protein